MHTYLLVTIEDAKSQPAVATQVMYRPVGERLLKLMPSPETPPIAYTMSTFFFLAGFCAVLMFKVEKLKGTFELDQIQRTLVAVHVFRFWRSVALGVNEVSSSFYLDNVLPFHDLPITASIAAFYTTIRVFPKLLGYVPVLVPFLLLSILVFMSKVPTQVSCSNTELVDQQDDAALPALILPIMEFFQMDANDTFDIEVIDHLAIHLLAGICIDLVVQLEMLRGTYQLIPMVLVPAGRHFFYMIQFFFGGNKAHPLYYLRKVLLFDDIPFTMTYVVLYHNFSYTFTLVFILESIILACIHKFISEREKLNIIQLVLKWLLRTNLFGNGCFNIMLKQGTEPEQEIRPTQASSSDAEELPPQQNHDAPINAIFSALNLSPYDPPIGDGGSPSVHVASDRVNRDLSAANEESVAVAAKSICESTDFSKWERRECIGHGGFGTVYVCHDGKTGRSCAVKQLKNIHDTEDREFIKKEIDILSKLEHSNIIKYYGHKEVGPHIYLYMEYIKPGSLKQYMKQGALDENLIRKFTAQILSGLVYLHSEKVVHRDLKTDNILVDYGDIVKLVDFGLSKKIEESVGKHSVGATYEYAAPEVRGREGYNRTSGFAADIWSLGCVIIEMFSGNKPQPVSETEHPPIPDKLCEEGKDFLRCCFKITPIERQSAAQLQEHRFVKPQTT